MRTFEKLVKQNYVIGCYTCEHNGRETCKGCNTILNGENEPYENWQLREDLCQKDKQIADLQHRLEVAEKALNKMSNSAIHDNDLYDLVNDFNIINERYDEDHLGIDTCDVVDYFKDQAEQEVRGEELWKECLKRLNKRYKYVKNSKTNRKVGGE
jgi:hypothetical protein